MPAVAEAVWIKGFGVQGSGNEKRTLMNMMQKTQAEIVFGEHHSF
jgi:hypothetical protein